MLGTDFLWLYTVDMAANVAAAAVTAAMTSDAPEVSYAKQRVTCVGTDSWQRQRRSLPFFLCFDELAANQPTVWLFRLQLRSQQLRRTSANLTAMSIGSSRLFVSPRQRS